MIVYPLCKLFTIMAIFYPNKTETMIEANILQATIHKNKFPCTYCTGLARRMSGYLLNTLWGVLCNYFFSKITQQAYMYQKFSYVSNFQIWAPTLIQCGVSIGNVHTQNINRQQSKHASKLLCSKSCARKTAEWYGVGRSEYNTCYPHSLESTNRFCCLLNL